MKPLTGVGGSASRTAERFDPSDEPLIARLSTLAPSLDGEPDPEWQARTRARLVAMAAVRTPEPEPVSPLRRLMSRQEGARSAWRTRLTAGLAGAAAAVTGLASVVALSGNAGPGDALYGVKRGTEQGQLALAGDARGRTLLEFASTRLDEVSVLIADDAPADVVADTLATMDAQTADGVAWLTRRAVETGSSASLDDLAGWSAGQSAGLTDIRDDVPAAAQDDVAASASLLDDVGQRVEGLRVALDCPTGPATDGSDSLGPVPGECATAPAPPAPGGPDATITDAPSGTAVPTPSTEPGENGSGGNGDPGTGEGGTGDPGTPGGQGQEPRVPSPPTPGLPDLPTVPKLDLPPLLSDRENPVPPPSGAPATPSSGTGGLGGGLLPDDLCVPGLIGC